MIDHVAIAVRDLARSRALYAHVLAPLGYVELTADDTTVGFGKRYPEFWLDLRPAAVIDPDSGMHICLRARDAQAVRAFHDAAVANGCTSDRGPGTYEVARVV